MADIPTVTLADIEAAREVLEGVSIYTPMEGSRRLTELAGGPVHLKCENLQRTGSFKIRGAYVRMSRLSPEERAAGVVAASAGNHAQGVALAAQMLGIKATVFMPEGAPIPKEKATRGYGADVVFEGKYIDQALDAARAFAAETGAVLIHPFDHEDIVAGQGTCGLEVLEQVPDVATVLVPTGGGGLIAGMAIAIKTQRPDVRVVAVQAAGAASLPESLLEGHPVPLESMTTMADGIAVGCPGDGAVRGGPDVRRRRGHRLRGVAGAGRARARGAGEDGGGAGRRGGGRGDHGRPGVRSPRPVVAVLSGGNIDPLLLGKVIRHGMAAAGRYLHLRVCIPDVPGRAGKLLGDLAAVQPTCSR